MMGWFFGRRVAAPPEVPNGVVIRSCRWIPAIGGWFTGTGRPAAAVTLGRTIVVHPDVTLSRRLLTHELAHVRQWRRSPVTFPLRYAWLHLRHGYTDNPYEVEAREAETRHS